ncbi:hypothetical protein [Alsobacter metallidurans]|uniref:hypothetical protein n=1 Tax=Alsobacter metallidurans TaxID=340221 RepID=UPI00166AA51D|nr:hypothetical protein [Alsobacter metallidurans]
MQNCFSQWLEAVARHCQDGQRHLVHPDRLVLRDWFVDRIPPQEAARRISRCVDDAAAPPHFGEPTAVRPAA